MMQEIINARGKTYKVFDMGNGIKKCRIHAKPIHYVNPSNGQLDEIDTALESSETDYIANKNSVSVGFRKDKNKDKFMGIRAHNNDNQQFELSIYDIEIDNNKINFDKFSSVSMDSSNNSKIKHDINDGLSLYTQLHEAYTRTAIKSVNPVSSFSMSFQIDIDGWQCINSLNENTYIPDARSRFNFVSTDGTKIWLAPPIMWDELGDESRGINHTLKYSGNKLIYTKSSNADGEQWLQSATEPLYIDAVIYYGDTGDGLSYKQSGAWPTARGSSTQTGAIDNFDYNANTSSAKYDGSLFYYTYRGWFWFDTSAIGANTVTSASLFLYGYGLGESSVCAMQSTQPNTGIGNWLHNAFAGSEYGHTASWSIVGYNEIVFNSTGMSDLVTDGTTPICTREYDHDYLNSTPTTHYMNGCYFADNTGTSQDPYLEVEFSAILSDSATANMLLSISDSEIGVFADTQNVNVSLSPAESEVGTFIDTQNVNVSLSPAESEIGTFIELQNVNMALSPGASEIVSYIDSDNVNVSLSPDSSETVVLVDSAVANIVLSVDETEHFTFVDAASGNIILSIDTESIDGLNIKQIILNNVEFVSIVPSSQKSTHRLTAINKKSTHILIQGNQ